jgi:hypothetical protein
MFGEMKIHCNFTSGFTKAIDIITMTTVPHHQLLFILEVQSQQQKQWNTFKWLITERLHTIWDVAYADGEQQAVIH